MTTLDREAAISELVEALKWYAELDVDDLARIDVEKLTAPAKWALGIWRSGGYGEPQ